jgi:hypothetical protein
MVLEYLYSAYHNLLAPLIVPENEEDNFGDEPEDNYMCNPSSSIACVEQPQLLVLKDSSGRLENQIMETQ